VPGATERVHEELAADGPLTRSELLERLDDLSDREVDTALEHLSSAGDLTLASQGYDVDLGG
jgi:hypothetical protein